MRRPFRDASTLLALCCAIAGCDATTTETETVVRRPPPPKPPEEIDFVPASKQVPVEVEVSGGGPLLGDTAAADRIKAQFPTIPNWTTFTDAEALNYARTLQQFLPGIGSQISKLTGASQCAVDHGLVGARAYFAPDRSQAGVILVVSKGQLERLPQIVVECLVEKLAGGGPPETGQGFRPCFDHYAIDSVVSNVPDTYYVIILGTHQSWCDFVRTHHKAYNQRPIG